MKQSLKMHAAEAALDTVEALRLWVLEHAGEASTPDNCKLDRAKEGQKPFHLTTPSEAAEYLGVAQKTLSNWRSLGLGPMYLKIGSRVAYDLNALRAFVRISGVSEPAEGGVANDARS